MSMFCDGLRSRIAVCDFFKVADFKDRKVTKLVSENLFSDFRLCTSKDIVNERVERG